MTLAHLSILLIPAALCGCVAATPGARAAADSTPAGRGLALAEAQCSGCHGVARGQRSPNPQAPSFDAVANELDFTPETLRAFFLDGHDTPAQMSMQLEEEDAEAVAAYILSLRKPR